jgi:hypothetical protein
MRWQDAWDCDLTSIDIKKTIISRTRLVKLWYTSNQKQQLRHQGNWLSLETNLHVLIATGVFSFFSRHKLFKDKFTWKSQLSLDYKRPKSEPNSPVVPTWRKVIDVTSNRARQLRWMCGLCMKQRHSIIQKCGADNGRGAKRKLMVRNFCFWRPYIVLCVDTHCVLYTNEIYRYGATRWVVKHFGRVSGFLTRIWKWDAKTKAGNIDPLLT